MWCRFPIVVVCLITVLCAAPFGCTKNDENATESRAGTPSDPIIRLSPPPKVLFPLPPFELTDQNGAVFKSSSLDGNLWVASFFFTRCQTICPKVVQAIKAVQDGMTERNWNTHLVTITVDPEHDTPEILRKKGEEVGADFSRWHFLTADPSTIKDLVMKGFKVAIGDPVKNAEGVMDITHAAQLMLIDEKGNVVGLFESHQKGVGELLEKMASLIDQNPRQN
jgi:protein SCO1/2